ncbi:TorF family putative porin [Dokdonella sp.]|uniref:TorF family putative porin n=1 Tax=Dokdonella sp. TaxID=2291710 RepID=UPI0035298C8E
MKSRFPVACLLVSFSGLAAMPLHAEEPSSLGGSLDIASDYRFRGLTQTNGDPALQGGIEYASSSGFYTGAWGSNISWLSDGQDSVSSSIELDGYAGFRGSWGDAVSYDIGLQYYWYPGSYPSGFNDADTWEGYASLGWSILTLKYSYAFTDLFGISDSEGSGYLDLSLSQGFAEKWTFDAHVGRQWVDGDNALSYTDWSLGLSYDIGSGFGVSLAYIDTNASKDLYTNAFGKYVGDATGVLTLSKAF